MYFADLTLFAVQHGRVMEKMSGPRQVGFVTVNSLTWTQRPSCRVSGWLWWTRVLARR